MQSDADPDPQEQHSTTRVKMTLETPSPKGVLIDPVKSAMCEIVMMRRCVESTALPAGFAELEYLQISSCPITLKKSMASRIQRTGWLIIWKQ